MVCALYSAQIKHMFVALQVLPVGYCSALLEVDHSWMESEAGMGRVREIERAREREEEEEERGLHKLLKCWPVPWLWATCTCMPQWKFLYTHTTAGRQEPHMHHIPPY